MRSHVSLASVPAAFPGADGFSLVNLGTLVLQSPIAYYVLCQAAAREEF
jgi:hypothetical protein